MPAPPTISNHNLFHLHRHIPRSWRHPPPPPPKKQAREPAAAAACPPPLPSLADSVTSLATDGRLPEAFAAFSLLLRRRLSLSPRLLLRSLSSLLSFCAALRALPQGRQIHANAVSLGLLRSPRLAARLAAFYAGLGLLSDARAAARDSSSRGLLRWNLLISGYARARLWREAALAFKQMVTEAVRADKFTYSCVLRACGQIAELVLGQQIHGSTLKRAFALDLGAWNALVAMYAKCGALDVARKLFDAMRARDVISWNSMISAYGSRGMWEEAFGLLERMQAEGLDASVETWNSIIGANLRMSKPTDALRLISQMRRSGFAVDYVTLVLGLDACSRIGSLRLGRIIHGFAVHAQCDGIDNVRNALITMYSRCKSIRYAYMLFEMTKVRSLITWNAMIAGFAIQDQVKEGFSVFRQMVRCGVKPNKVTLLSILPLCACLANLHHGQVIHCFLVKHGLEHEQSLCNTLIDMYSKSGWLSAAQGVFDTMSNHDAISYTSLIAGYGMQSDGSTALELFDEMIQCSIKPDHVTMVAVLSACSHSRLVSQGEQLFSKMVTVYNVMPRLEHFSCMVDLYCRTGSLRKAEEIIDRMAFRPSNAMLATLIGACLAHGNIEIGLRAAQKLLARQPDDPGHFVLIARMYERSH